MRVRLCASGGYKQVLDMTPQYLFETALKDLQLKKIKLGVPLL